MKKDINFQLKKIILFFMNEETKVISNYRYEKTALSFNICKQTKI